MAFAPEASIASTTSYIAIPRNMLNDIYRAFIVSLVVIIYLFLLDLSLTLCLSFFVTRSILLSEFYNFGCLSKACYLKKFFLLFTQGII